jgi:uracil-DNA glycosylase
VAGRLGAGERGTIAALEAIQRDIRALRLPGFAGAPVHGPAVPSRIYLLGQAPGPHEARLGRPFAWTAGRTLFRWFAGAFGASEEEFRARVYMAAVVRAFPGKDASGGDRVPSRQEILASRGFIEREVAALRPRLVIPVGKLAIGEVLGGPAPLAAVVGRKLRLRFLGIPRDVICLPHPSGASAWTKTEPGRTLTAQALRILARHPEIRSAFPRDQRRAAVAISRRARMAAR